MSVEGVDGAVLHKCKQSLQIYWADLALRLDARVAVKPLAHGGRLHMSGPCSAGMPRPGLRLRRPWNRVRASETITALDGPSRRISIANLRKLQP